MKSSLQNPLRNAAVCSLFAALAVTGAHAADGTWTQINSGTASGTWSTSGTTSWADNIVADGSGSTANFATLDVSGTSTVTLASSRTIGNLIFGDTGTNTPSLWIFTGGGPVLTLAGTAPTITNNVSGENSRVAVNVILAGTNGLTKDGVGTVALGSANTYTGGTFINQGRLRARNSSALSTGVVNVADGAGLEVDNSVTVANTVNLNGSNALTQITGNNTLSGVVNLQSASQINLTGASGSLGISGTLNMGTHTLTASGARTLTLSGAIVGTGTLNLANFDGTTIISNDNSSTFSGAVAITRSTVALGSNGALGTGTVNLGVDDQGSGIRSMDTTARTVSNVLTLVGTVNSTYNFGSSTAGNNGDLSFTNATSISLGSVIRKFQVYNRTQFDAAFTGGGGITTQTGTGTLVMNGDSTYTGATTVNAGTLLVNGSISSATGGVTVGAAGTLGGGGTIAGATTVNGSLTPGENGLADELTFGSSLNIAGISAVGALKFDLGTTSDMVTLTSGALTIGNGLLNWNDFSFTALSGFAPGNTYVLFSTNQAIIGTLGSSLTGTIGGYNGTLSLADGGTDVILTVVPEPTTAVLAGAGLMTVLFLRRRQRLA